MKLAVLKSESSPVETSQSLKFQRTKSDHGAESVLVATEKMTVVIVQLASEYTIIIQHIIHTTYIARCRTTVKLMKSIQYKPYSQSKPAI